MARILEDVELAAAHGRDHKKVESQRAEAAHPAVGPTAQRQTMTPSSVLHLQRSIGNAGTSAYLQREEREGEERSPVHEVIGSGGTALDEPTRETMEEHLGADLSGVRLHLDRDSTESVSAAAYTVGNDVVLHPDHFSPGTPSAQRTLAHELTHVVQQRSGPVDGTPREGGIKVSDPSDRFEREAERSADSLMQAAQRQTTAQVGGPSLQRVGVQRVDEEALQGQFLQREEEEEELQGLFVQREGEEDEMEGEDEMGGDEMELDDEMEA